MVTAMADIGRRSFLDLTVTVPGVTATKGIEGRQVLSFGVGGAKAVPRVPARRRQRAAGHGAKRGHQFHRPAAG
jgi:hypothetical protein